MNGMNDKELQELTEESEEISAEYKSDETELDAQDGTGCSDEDEDEDFEDDEDRMDFEGDSEDFVEAEEF